MCAMAGRPFGVSLSGIGARIGAPEDGATKEVHRKGSWQRADTYRAHEGPKCPRRRAPATAKERYDGSYEGSPQRYPRTEHNPLPFRRYQDGPRVAPVEALARLRVAARGFRQVGRGRLGRREGWWGG